MRVGRAIALVIACAACGSEGTESQSPSGNVLGSGFIPPNSAASLSESIDCYGTYVAVALLGFSSSPEMCDEVADPCLSRASTTTVVVRMQRFGAAAQPTFGPGTYSIGATGEVAGTLVVYAGAAASDATCGTSASAAAIEGTLVLDALDESAVRGRVDLTFDDGGSFSGPFDVPRCGAVYDACGGDVCVGAPICS